MTQVRRRAAAGAAVAVVLLLGLAAGTGLKDAPAPVTGMADGEDPEPEREGGDAGDELLNSSLPYDITAYETDASLEETAAGLLEGYRNQGRCAPLAAGYLDLLGDQWSCEVEGEGWVDLCFVSRKESEGARSAVRVLRLSSQDWEAALAEDAETS